MNSLITFPLHSFTFVIFIVLLTSSTSSGADNRYEKCSTSMVSCGKSPDFGYPFWGAGRPQYCGHPDLQVLCYEIQGEVYPVLKIRDDVESCYKVISTFPSSNEMTIQLQELPNTCPFHGFNTIFYDYFQVKTRVKNITLFYDCPEEHTPDVSQKSITCRDGQTTTYYLNRTLEAEAELRENCRAVEVPVPKNELDHPVDPLTPSDVLYQEFEVEYLNFSDCSRCQESGGICGSHDTEFTCYYPKKEHWKLIVGIAIPAGFLTIIALNVGVCWCMKRKSYMHMWKARGLPSIAAMNSDIEIGNSFCGIAILPYNELQEATNNFDESKELGDGGFGIVYYGKLRDGREVAVKRLYEKNYKRIEQFMNEIEILTRLRHPNLVTLYGCTSRHSRELLLVYEFIPNGTVADHLYGEQKGSETLSWDIRMKIAIETASALSYLHTLGIIHRDVKTNNILLDNNFSVKVADFGLSRLFPNDATHVSTVPQGTPGYLDPQYHRNYQVTSKSDVYSFGVVLVELISSLPAVDISRQEDEINLYDYAMNKIQNGMLSELVDEKLDFESDFKVTRMITLVAELAFRCLQQEKELRPTMDEVLEALKKIRNTDYEVLKEEDMKQSIAASKPTSLAAENETKAPLENTLHPCSPNSVIGSWISKSTASNTSS